MQKSTLGFNSHLQKQFKFSRNGNTITFYWGAMVQILEIPEGEISLYHKKGSVTITSNNAEGYVYDPVFVNGSKDKVEFN